MTLDEQIAAQIKNIAKTKGVTVQAKVKSVDENEATATVIVGNGFEIEDVRLRSVVDNNDGLVIIPKVDSIVYMLRLGGSDEFLIVGYSEFEKVVIKNGSTSLEINDEKIIFNDGVLGSNICDISKLVSKINTIENDVNNLKTLLSTWLPVPMDGGASLKAFVATWAAAPITNTTAAAIKDPKIEN